MRLIATCLFIAVGGPVLAQAELTDQQRALGAEMAKAIIINYGVGQTIETVCPGWEVTEGLQLGWHAVGQGFRDKAPMIKMLAIVMEDTAKTYRLKQDRAGFCARILAVHGPNGDPPKVQRKR